MPEVQPLPPNTTVLVENKGTKFSVGLLANAGTGYVWKQKLDTQNIVKFIGEETVPLTPPRPGNPVEFRFDYEAVKKGTALATFEYIGPDKKIAKTDTIDFVVA